MPGATPQLQLETLFVLDARRRIRSTREPRPSPGPGFVFIRSAANCAWAVRADVADRVAGEIDRLASDERPSAAWDQPMLHARRYEEVLGGRMRWGPAFEFPDQLSSSGSATGSRSGSACEPGVVRDEAPLGHHFAGWTSGEIEAGRAPVMAVHGEDGHPVSICFCARRSSAAAEAGVETAAAFRGRGYAPRVTTAWASAVRELGLIPLYSTDWQNLASLSVARKLALVHFATDFSVEM
jgi:hypothetical protein